MILLKDLPGFELFERRCNDSISGLALFFVGKPESAMQAVLEQTRRDLATDLAPILGANTAKQIADGFVTAIAGLKKEIELSSPIGEA